MEPVLVRAGLLSAEEVKAHRPGGADNPQTGAHGWLRYLIVLQRRHAQSQQGTASAALDLNSGTVLDALAGAPERVALVDGAGDLLVHPKSAGALFVLHKIDLKLGFLTVHRDSLRMEPGTAETLDLLLRTEEAILYYHHLVVWALTTPGPGLPWERGNERPELPSTQPDLTTIDFYRLAAAHQRVHHTRNLALEGLLTSVSHGIGSVARLSWPSFLGSVAIEMGVKSETLLWEWSLGAVLASTLLAASAKRDAAAAATEQARAAR